MIFMCGKVRLKQGSKIEVVGCGNFEENEIQVQKQKRQIWNLIHYLKMIRLNLQMSININGCRKESGIILKYMRAKRGLSEEASTLLCFPIFL